MWHVIKIVGLVLGVREDPHKTSKIKVQRMLSEGDADHDPRFLLDAGRVRPSVRPSVQCPAIPAFPLGASGRAERTAPLIRVRDRKSGTTRT